MKDLTIKALWIVLSIILIVWTTYQSWHWFFTEKSPVVHAMEVTEVAPPTIHVSGGTQYSAPYQNYGNVVQKTAPASALK